MSYISFTILTDTPARLRQSLIDRGILKSEPGIMFAREGGEEREIPNPILTQLEPPIRDTRRVWLVKLARAAKDDEEAGQTTLGDILDTKYGRWVMANSASAPLTGFINGQAINFPARKVTGQNVWLTRATLGEWQ